MKEVVEKLWNLELHW